MSRHQGKGVVVTGGAMGIGRGIVERFAREGAHVVIADINAEAAAEVVASCGPSVTYCEADVRDEQALRRAVSIAVDRAGALDVMVNNAGIMKVAPLVETSLDDWRSILDINVIGIALGSKVGAEEMIRAGRGGSIVNASSGGGRHGVPNFSQYCATKAAVIMLSQSLAIELAPHRIRVNCYTPGHIMTPLWEGIVDGIGRTLGKSRDETLDMFLSTVPAGRFGTPDDVAAAVSWVCTDEASYVSGQCLAMNGAELPW